MRNPLALVVLLLAGVAAAQGPTNLMVSVRTDNIRDEAAFGGAAAYRSRSGFSEQRIMVMDGGQAALRAGSTRPLRLRQIERSPWGQVISEQIVYRALGQGFKVRPRLNGERVVVEISASTEEPGPVGASMRSFELSTAVEGRLGEWLPVGDSMEAQYAEGASQQGARILLRVDLSQ